MWSTHLYERLSKRTWLTVETVWSKTGLQETIKSSLVWETDPVLPNPNWCVVVDIVDALIWPPVTSQQRAMEAFRQSTCLFSNSVFITSQLGGDLKREAGATINRRGRTGVKRQINKQAIILRHTHTHTGICNRCTPGDIQRRILGIPPSKPES